MTKPTIKELEAILEDPKVGTIEIMPDGSIRTIKGDEVATLRKKLALAEAQNTRYLQQFGRLPEETAP